MILIYQKQFLSRLKKNWEKYNNFIINNRQILSGNNVICQIDESMFSYKQKYFEAEFPKKMVGFLGLLNPSLN